MSLEDSGVCNFNKQLRGSEAGGLQTALGEAAWCVCVWRVWKWQGSSSTQESEGPSVIVKDSQNGCPFSGALILT